MKKTLLYRMFGLGAIPKGVKDQIQKEGVVLQDEGLGGSVTFKKYRVPGKYYGWRRNWFSGSIVLTREHFLAFNYSKPVIGIGWTEEKLKTLDIAIEKDNTLCVKFEASTFDENASGEIEVRFSTPLAKEILKRIKEYTGK